MIQQFFKFLHFRVAWKNRCKDDPDLERYTRDCKDDESGKSFLKFFQPGVMEPSKRKGNS